MSPRKINQVSVLLLLVGFGSALAVFLSARAAPPDQFQNDPLAEKKYLRELRVMGGKANELAAEFQDWFAGLWEGEQLARTIVVLTVVTTLGFRWLAAHPEPDAGPASRPPGPLPGGGTDRAP